MAIVAESASRRFGKEVAVAGLDLRLPAGCIFGFIGPSGAGKTTTIRMLTGLIPPSAGTIRVLDRDPATFTAADRQRLGYMPQLSALYPQLSVSANLRFAAALYGLSGSRRRRRTKEVLDFVELWPHRRKPVSAISGGMQRRLALACALVHQPAILFLDEPTAGLDPLLRNKMWQQFEALRDEGRTLFVTTQHIAEARWCDRVGLMVAGRLVADETPAGLSRLALGGDVLVARTLRPCDPTLRELLNLTPGVRRVSWSPEDPGRVEVVVDDSSRRLHELAAALAPAGIVTLEPLVPSFDELFAMLVARAGAPHAGADTPAV